MRDQIRNELKKGGDWLGAAREWMQRNVHDGDRLTWGSEQVVQLPFKALEELALHAAVAAVQQERAKPANTKV